MIQLPTHANNEAFWVDNIFFYKIISSTEEAWSGGKR